MTILRRLLIIVMAAVLVGHLLAAADAFIDGAFRRIERKILFGIDDETSRHFAAYPGAEAQNSDSLQFSVPPGRKNWAI